MMSWIFMVSDTKEMDARSSTPRLLDFLIIQESAEVAQIVLRWLKQNRGWLWFRSLMQDSRVAQQRQRTVLTQNDLAGFEHDQRTINFKAGKRHRAGASRWFDKKSSNCWGLVAASAKKKADRIIFLKCLMMGLYRRWHGYGAEPAWDATQENEEGKERLWLNGDVLSTSFLLFNLIT